MMRAGGKPTDAEIDDFMPPRFVKPKKPKQKIKLQEPKVSFTNIASAFGFAGKVNNGRND